MKLNAFECPKCSAVVFSRTRHDYRRCPCGTIAVDGGLEYTRVVWKDVLPESHKIEVDATREQLYDDWNKRSDKFGIVLSSKDTNPKNPV